MSRSPSLVVALGALLGVVTALSACDQPGARPTPPPDSSTHPGASASAPVAVAEPEQRLAPLQQRTYSIAVEGNLAHAGTEAGIVSYDVENRQQPKRLATLTLPDSVNNVSLLGGASPRLAAAVGPSGLAIVDASAARSGKLVLLNTVPWKPAQRGACHSVWKAISNDGRKAFLACGNGGIAEADTINPAELKVTRVLPVDDYVRDLVLLDQASGVPLPKASPFLVAAAAGRSGMLIVDFRPPGDPKVVARVETSGETRALAIRSGLAYVAEGAAGLRIIDLRNPSLPVVLGQLRPNTTDMLRGVALSDRTAWVCAGESGLLAVDVTSPASPKLVGSHDPERALNRAAVLGTTLVAANDADGLLILDVADPTTPRVLYPLPGQPH